MRWPFGPPHLTLKPSKKNKQKKKIKKEKKTKEKKKQKTQNTKKELFSYQSVFLFLVGVQNFPFLTTWPKKRAPKNTIKIGVSATHFLENSFASRNGHFWTKKAKSRNSSYHFFCPFSSLSTTKNTKIS